MNTSSAIALGLACTLSTVRVIAQTTAPPIPTPESHLGFPVGADFHLATYDESVAYFQRLADVSDRITLIDVGVTSEGRRWQAALISSPNNLAEVERHRATARRLARPSGLTDADARALARGGRAIVHIDGGLHASEVAGAQHTIQLAYDLVATPTDPKIAAILDNVIVMLWPSINPDGQHIVAEWYRQNLGTPYEVAPLIQLYQKYIGHDNNRDAYMLNMIESREIARIWRLWEPQIIYVHHQTAPFPTRIWLPPFAEPIASQAPPLMSRTVNMIGMAIAQGLEANGQPGATHMGTGFDAWYPGYVDYMPMLQHQAAFWTETALYRYATPHFYTVADFPDNQRDLRPRALYASPWTGGWWRLRDAVDYMRTASLSVLDYAAKYREELLYNRYQSGRNVVRKYEREPPFAYLVPPNQRDPVAATAMLRRLAFNGIDVYATTGPVTIDHMTFAEGTWVVPTAQPFGELARQLLDVQTYPDLREFPDGPPEQPYDAAGWTLPLQMGVDVVTAQSPLGDAVWSSLRLAQGDTTARAEFDIVAAPGFDSHPVAAGIAPPPGEISGAGPALTVNPSQNNAFRLINRAIAGGGRVRFAADPGGNARYVIEGITAARHTAWVRELALRARRGANGEGPAVRPRIGLYRPWRPSMDEGWTRWLLERYEFPFANLRNADVHAGNLRDRFDVIVLAADAPSTILDGLAPGTVPARYAGGIGAVGVRALDAFVRAGGTLVCFNQASTFAIEQLHLPVRDVVGDRSRRDFFVSGSLLEVMTDPAHPVMAGMPRRASIFVDRSPVFTTLEGFEGAALAVYPATGSPLLSGYLLGEGHLQGYAAALDVRHGDGHVILLGFRPQWRGQPHGTFRVVFNAALFADRHAAAPHGTPDFWTPPAEPESPGSR